MDLRALPKIELHLHLDCSLSYRVVKQLRPATTRRQYQQNFIAPSKCLNLADLLRTAANGIALMQTEVELRAVTDDLFDQLREDGVIYAEIRFAPLLHTAKGLTAQRVVAVVEETVGKASARTGIAARIILCALRHFSEAQSLETVRLVERFRGTHVAALDLAANEAGFPIDAHVPAFRHAIAHNISRTAHAGEARGADSVWETLEHFRPARIGHGVRSIEDASLITHLRDQQIHLEVCPTCNVQINLFQTHADHPIQQLYEAGLSVGINTDSRAMTPVTLSEEYHKLQQTFGWNSEQFLRCNRNALAAAFIPETEKNLLRQRLESGYMEFR